MPRAFQAVAIGGSAGALPLVLSMLGGVARGFPATLLVCLHLPRDDRGALARCLAGHLALPVVEACDKMPALAGRVHVASAGYHLLVEDPAHLALSIDPPVHFCRPAIDVLFDSAARAHGPALLAILLSGANEDGAAGLLEVRRRGGLAVAQSPASAAYPCMPEAGLARGGAELVLDPPGLGELLQHVEAWR